MNKSSSRSNANNSAEADKNVENENPTRSAIEELLQTKAKLTKALENKRETKRQWRQRQTALECSNWKLELEHEKLRSETDELDKEILGRVNDSQKTHDELEAAKLRNKQEAADFWNYFQEEAQKYSNLFTNAHIEYSSVCLNQDIEEYGKESEIVKAKIANIEKEMEIDKARYGLVELGTNEEAKLLADLEAVKKDLSDKSHIVRATESIERTINVLQLKIKQKEQDIAYLKNKSHKK